MKIDLSKLPEGTKWIAIDSDGEVYGYAREPVLENESEYWADDGGYSYIDRLTCGFADELYD